MITLEISPPRHERCDGRRTQAKSRNLVLVASESSSGRYDAGRQGSGDGEVSRARSLNSGPSGLQTTRLDARSVIGYAAFCRRLAHRTSVSPLFAEPIGAAPRGIFSNTVDYSSGILDLLEHSNEPCDHRAAIAEAVVALRDADAVIAGPFSAGDANAPGLLPHLAALASGAYRALRPPRELLVHPAFGQIARLFQFIQMTHHHARSLGTGAIDLGILGQRLRRLQGDAAEFAITDFHTHGLHWADGAWWDIEPIGDVDESFAGAMFSIAWVVARRFQRASAERALAYAREIAAKASLNRIRNGAV
jgi:hypothetical protein